MKSLGGGGQSFVQTFSKAASFAYFFIPLDNGRVKTRGIGLCSHIYTINALHVFGMTRTMKTLSSLFDFPNVNSN